MIVLATDFGTTGPYVGQMRAVLAQHAPQRPVIDLFSDLTPFEPRLAAPLLPAYTAALPPGTIVIAVVDPGVGGARAGVILRADGLWFVGPDNGLLTLVARRAHHREVWALSVPPGASASFHGRDVFAPAAARLAAGILPEGALPMEPSLLEREGIPDDPPWVVYIDSYGNALTGLRVESLPQEATLAVGLTHLPRARTFSDLALGQPFCYRNANGLFEIAVNQGRADQRLALRPGMAVTVMDGTARTVVER